MYEGTKGNNSSKTGKIYQGKEWKKRGRQGRREGTEEKRGRLEKNGEAGM